MCMMGRAAGEVVTGLRKEGQWVGMCLCPRSHMNAPENARGDAQVPGIGERGWRLLPGGDRGPLWSVGCGGLQPP